MGTIDEAALTTDGLGSVDPDGTLGAQALVESSPATAAAVVAAAAAGVKVVPDPNQEEPRQRLKQAQREAKHTRLERCHRSICLLYTSPSPRDGPLSRMPSSA